MMVSIPRRFPVIIVSVGPPWVHMACERFYKQYKGGDQLINNVSNKILVSTDRNVVSPPPPNISLILIFKKQTGSSCLKMSLSQIFYITDHGGQLANLHIKLLLVHLRDRMEITTNLHNRSIVIVLSDWSIDQKKSQIPPNNEIDLRSLLLNTVKIIPQRSILYVRKTVKYTENQWIINREIGLFLGS